MGHKITTSVKLWGQLRSPGGARRSKEEEVTGGWRDLPNKERVINSNRIKWTGHVAKFRELINTNKILFSAKPQVKIAYGRIYTDYFTALLLHEHSSMFVAKLN
jgi:hypothetical protein